MGALCLWAPSAAAQEGAPEALSRDFTFKRMAVPTPGSPNKITVQIDPYEQERLAQEARARMEARAARERAEAEIEVDIAAAPPAPYDWFWSKVSPLGSEAGPANVARALTLLGNAPEANPPRLQDLQDIAAAYGPHILMASVGTNVSPALIVAMIAVESSGRVTAESEKGAQGLMQLIPATAERFGVKDVEDPADNIRGGAAYLNWLMSEFDGDPILALAGYNAGENAVRAASGVPDYAETRAYVPKVLGAFIVARGLCLTPPELITDGCVFAVNRVASNG